MARRGLQIGAETGRKVSPCRGQGCSWGKRPLIQGKTPGLASLNDNHNVVDLKYTIGMGGAGPIQRTELVRPFSFPMTSSGAERTSSAPLHKMTCKFSSRHPKSDGKIRWMLLLDALRR